MLPSSAIAGIMVLMFVITVNIYWGGERWRHVLQADAKGYYAYLPAVFIYQDLNFSFFDHIEKEKYYRDYLYYDYRAFVNGAYLSKYYMGTSVVQLPFFLGAHLLTKATGGDADGYSKYYLLSVGLAALFSLFIGLLCLNRTLRTFNISALIRVIILFSTVFGTNLFYYASSEAGMSHIHSFAYISLFVYLARRYFISHNSGNVIAMGAVLGLIVLIRPVNGLILLILPFIAGSSNSFMTGLKRIFKQYGVLLLALLIFSFIVSLQLIYYKLATGSFFIYTYIGEGIHLNQPHVFNILFSFKKGLFLYTPIYLLAFSGCFYLWQHSRFMCWNWAMFFLIITYIFSSWSNWWYGGSFSSRVYVEYLPLFMLMLAFGLAHAGKRMFKWMLGVIAVLIVVCQIQTFQYRYNQIHWAEMDRQKYFEVFLRIDKLM